MQGIQFVEKMETTVLFFPILLPKLIKQDWEPFAFFYYTTTIKVHFSK
jgi:hypothetical protein